MDHPGHELPVQRIPNIGPAVEFYFSPDGKRIIGIARREGDEFYRVHTLNIDGTDIRRINDRGKDACSYFFPDGKRIVWTSTRDHPDCRSAITPTLPTIRRVPSSTRRISTAATSAVSPTTSSTMPRSRCRPTASGCCSADKPTARWTYGKCGRTERRRCGSPGSKAGSRAAASTSPTTAPSSSAPGERSTSAAKTACRCQSSPSVITAPQLRRVTEDDGTNWSPYPAPDGRHFVFVKKLPPANFEIFLGDLESPEQVRLTYNDAFDGYPVISPDGRSLLFSSNRDAKPGERAFTLYLMDISSLGLSGDLMSP